MTFDEAVRAIEAAGTFADLLTRPPAASGGVASGSAASGRGGAAVEEPVDVYRRLAKLVHPDAAPAAIQPAATEAFAKLAALWGGFRPAVATGDIADLLPHDGDRALTKVPRRPADNDLMAAEATALRTLWTDGDPRHRAYAPRLIESYTHEDPLRARRTVNVLERLHGFVSLAEVLRRRPDGLDPRDAAWMWRRLLTGLGWAHRAGVVHGAVLPEHVLIHPAEHGVVLVDWCYAVRPGERIAALVSRHRDAYPPEVTAKRAATAATDLFMASVLMRQLIRRPPAPITRFLDGCLYDAPRMRPQDAWALLTELDELLNTLYGPRRFRPFLLTA